MSEGISLTYLSNHDRKDFQSLPPDSIKKLLDIQYALDQSAMVAITDQTGKITYVNQKFCDISKYSREELIGQDHRILNSGCHPKSFFQNMWITIINGNIWTGEMKKKAKDGTYYWVKTTIVPFLNEKGKPYQYISICQDITALKNLEKQLLFNAYLDNLTGLPNRHCFYEEVGAWLSKKKETDQIAMIFLDIDRFKYITDTLGHSVGDYFLKSISKRLALHLKDVGDVYRFEGDQFTIVVKNRSLTEVTKIIRKVKALLKKPFLFHNESYSFSASFGVSFSPQDGQDIETLVKKADIAMYRAKEKGNNSVQFFTNESHEALSKNMKIETALRQAIKKEEFLLYYQPLVDIKKREMVGVEALIRWNHPTEGIIPPSEFIPLAEETGLIAPITEWVLKTACKQIVKWHEEGLPQLYVAVNLSPFLLESNQFMDHLQKIIKENKLHPKYIELEITESMMQDPESAIPLLEKLKSLGVSLSIDDFGTGYSSLASLRRFTMDTLKIDRSFIDELFQDDGVIVKAILTMASHLGLNVIAEGIETKEQLQFLTKHTCPVGQGYLFSRPLPSNELEHLLQNPEHFSDI